MLASDANAVEETINNQIIKPLLSAASGASEGKGPKFRFRLKGVTEVQAMADVVKTLDEGGWEVSQATLSERLGFAVTRKDETEEVQNGND
jgi:phage gp29-like protein